MFNIINALVLLLHVVFYCCMKCCFSTVSHPNLVLWHLLLSCHSTYGFVIYNIIFLLQYQNVARIYILGYTFLACSHLVSNKSTEYFYLHKLMC